MQTSRILISTETLGLDILEFSIFKDFLFLFASASWDGDLNGINI
uniref:Uncharacterized protein n=1 Tax=Rhizophora mucronata TaxID=61149 RepID=A0A2P2PAY4_RHIMU